MCGIAAIIDHSPSELHLVEMLSIMIHRGDLENFGERRCGSFYAMGTNRLKIVDRPYGRQPISNADHSIHLVMNGEIYNYQHLKQQLQRKGYLFQTNSDTEVLLQSYIEWKEEVIYHLDGIFAFIIIDEKNNDFFAARDHIGIKPLYFARVKEKDAYYFASEKKAFIRLGIAPQEFPPGTYMTRHLTQSYITFQAKRSLKPMNKVWITTRCRELLTNAVSKQVNTDLPLGVIFSGGLDSTIMLYLASKFHPNVTAFTIHYGKSEDLVYAERYCQEHHIPLRKLPLSEKLIAQNIEQAIYYGELFEPIDISDFIVMSCVLSFVKTHGIKVVISGDGSDELFGGYDLFQLVSDPYALTTYRINNLYRTDLQRVDRSSMMHSIECRVPFLDKLLIQFACSLPFELKVKHGIEKYILREAFRGLIPDYIVNRKKIRMPEGIGINDFVMKLLKMKKIDSPVLSKKIHLDTPQIHYCLSRYLSYGFSLPDSRYKQKNWDYTKDGYFHFTNEGKTVSEMVS